MLKFKLSSSGVKSNVADFCPLEHQQACDFASYYVELTVWWMRKYNLDQPIEVINISDSWNPLSDPWR